MYIILYGNLGWFEEEKLIRYLTPEEIREYEEELELNKNIKKYNI
jgi:hypothetical protein